MTRIAHRLHAEKRTYRPGPDPLTPIDLIDFEAAHPRHVGAKEAAIREQLAMTPTRYYQLLIRAARTPDAIAHDPITSARINNPGRPRLP